MKTGKRTLLSAAVALLVSGAIAWAANTTFFTSLGDIVFPFSPPTLNGANPGTIDNMTIGATTPAPGTFTNLSASTIIGGQAGRYTKNQAPIGNYASYLFANNQTEMLFEPGSGVTYAYIELAAAPTDGQQVCVFSTQTITTLYLNANSGQTINNAITTLSANAHACYLYSLSNKTWDRSQ